jgi:hypothetical protein
MRIGTNRWLEYMRHRLKELERYLKGLEREEYRHHHRHHGHKDDFTVQLEFDKMSASLSIVVGDNTHAASLVVVNLDGTPAQGVAITFASDTPSVCGVDPASGALTPLAVGTANISGTGTRSTFVHSDTGVVTVTANDQGDFAATLALT